jgi:hypothetical protein
MKNNLKHLAIFLMAAFAMWIAVPSLASAHCDTMDGPAVADARIALEKSDITPILKWIKLDNEKEVTEAFKRALIVRGKGNEARELADFYFFETLVRVHRAGEGAPFTGLKPAGTAVDPAIKGLDEALESGSVDTLIKDVTASVARGIRERFERASLAKSHAAHNVEAGRQYVEAYVEFMHYVERLNNDAATNAARHTEGAAANIQHEH